MSEITLPEEIVKWLVLEKQYPEWNKTPEEVKDKLIHLACTFSGVETFRNEHYLDYILKLSKELYDCWVNEDDKKAEELNDKLKWIARLIYQYYSPSMVQKRETERKLARIFVEVEEYRSEHPISSINEATRRVADKLGYKGKEKYVHTRYYKMRRKLKGTPLETVKEKYHL